MSNEVEIRLPKLGESIVGATVVQWFKKEGDRVELDEALLEVSTDKVNSEIPSPVAGVIRSILVAENEEVEVGAPLAVVSVGVGAAEPKAQPQTAAPAPEAPAEEREEFLSPAVLQMARAEKVPLEQLQRIKGTGAGGRITKKDVEAYLSQKQADGASPPAKKAASGEEIVPLVGMRKAIADVMVRSHRDIPHASIVHEVDITELLTFIAARKERFACETGAKLTVTPFMVKALADACQRHPYLNATLESDAIRLKQEVNVGIAVAIEQEGVIVPVLRDCQSESVPSIAKKIFEMSRKARSGSLGREEVQGGTITLTNFGMAGALIGFPLIRPPEVAIVGMGAIQKRVAVLPGDLMAVRSMVHVTLSFDHRVVDGLYACAFLNIIKEKLENVDTSAF